LGWGDTDRPRLTQMKGPCPLTLLIHARSSSAFGVVSAKRLRRGRSALIQQGRPIAFEDRVMVAASSMEWERRNSLAVVRAICWRSHLLSSPHQFTRLNGPNPERLETKETLSQRQARWSAGSSALQLQWEWKGKATKADPVSRAPRFQIGNRGAQRNQHCVC
jgi:hypothetical protein